MEAYTGFAQVYDLFMDNVPYGEWSRYLIGLLREYGIKDGTVLELGCGTGKMTRLLRREGYDMIGVDSSAEMLELAAEASLTLEASLTQETEISYDDILYLLQDMRELELCGSVRAAVSVCDSLNYLLKEQDLLETFRRVRQYLEPGGIFIFDMNTLYKYRELLGEATIAENREEGSFIWENYFDAESGINEYDLTLFVREKDGLYRKYEETHFQRAYELHTVKDLLEKAGFTIAAAYDACTREPVRTDSERMYVIAAAAGNRNGGK